jgi:thiamine kinase-like enzyme
METYVKRHSTDVELLSDRAVVAGVERWVDPRLVDGTLRLWADRQRFLRWAREGPTTLGHHDLSPKNLFRLSDGFVLIDWAFAGRAGFGVDAGPYGLNAAADFWIAPPEVPAINDRLADSYLVGMQQEGWSGDPTAVRRSLAASAAIKFAWILPAICLGSISDWPTFNGKPLQEGMAWRAALVPEVLRQVDIARSLA